MFNPQSHEDIFLGYRFINHPDEISPLAYSRISEALANGNGFYLTKLYLQGNLTFAGKVARAKEVQVSWVKHCGNEIRRAAIHWCFNLMARQYPEEEAFVILAYAEALFYLKNGKNASDKINFINSTLFKSPPELFETVHNTITYFAGERDKSNVEAACMAYFDYLCEYVLNGGKLDTNPLVLPVPNGHFNPAFDAWLLQCSPLSTLKPDVSYL